MGNHSYNNGKKKGKSLLNRIRKAIIMAYVLLLFPTLLIYFVLVSFTSLTGRMIYYSLLPAAIILLILYVLYLIKPNLFPAFLERNDPQNENL